MDGARASSLGLYACADSLFVNDFDRIATIDPAPAIVRAERIVPAPGERLVRVRGVSADCRTFIVGANGADSPAFGEVGRRTIALAWGSLDATRRLPIGRFGMVDVQSRMVEDQPQPVALPWGATGSLAYAGDAVHYSPGDRGEIRTRVRSGGGRIVRWPVEETEITAEDEQRYGEMRDWFLGVFPQAEPMMPALDDTPRGEARPVILSMLVDDEGNLWARRYPAYVAGRPDLFDRDVPMRYAPPRSEEPEVWTVFDPSGRWLGDVETPADLVVRAIYRDLVIGVAKNVLDVEHLRAHRLRKEPGE